MHTDYILFYNTCHYELWTANASFLLVIHHLSQRYSHIQGTHFNVFSFPDCFRPPHRHTHTHTQTHTHTHTHTHTQRETHTHTNLPGEKQYTHTHTQRPPHTHTHTQTQRESHTHTKVSGE